MLLNNLLYANPNTSSNPVCVLKLLINSCYSFQSQKYVSIPLSISRKLPHAPKGSPVPLICLNYSHYAAVRQFKYLPSIQKKNLMFSMSNKCQARAEAA